MCTLNVLHFLLHPNLIKRLPPGGIEPFNFAANWRALAN